MHRLVGAIGTGLVGLWAVACTTGEVSPVVRAVPDWPARVVPVSALVAEVPLPPAAASSAPAVVAFPEGWTRGAVAAVFEPPPRPSPLSREALALRTSPPHRLVPLPTVLQISTLPVIEVGPRVDWNKEPTSPPSMDEAPELVFDWFGARGRDAALATAGASGVGAAVSVRDQRFGFLDINFYTSSSSPGAAGGLVASCGARGGTGYRNASWLSLARTDGADVNVVGADAWFDHHTCKAHVMRRIEGVAAPLPGGIGYAFRTRCPRCDVPVEELHLLLPELGWSRENERGGFLTERAAGLLSHLYVPLGPGAAGSIFHRFSASVLARWKTFGAPFATRGDALFGIEVSRVASEPEPTALVYVMDVPSE